MATIQIKGTIVANEDKWIYDYFEIESTSPADVAEALANVPEGEAVTLEISSGGGDVLAANEIYYAIATYSGSITADIVAWVASAASYIALAADKVRIVPTAMFMIHNVAGGAEGDYHVMDNESRILKNFNKAVSNAYRLKTGMSEQECLNLMDKESWLAPQDAKAKGFVDEIIGDENDMLSNTQSFGVYNGFSTIIPKAKIDEMRLLLKNQQLAQGVPPTPQKDEAEAITSAIQRRIIF